MKEIKHIVYLMLENRSMDNVLGWLYDTESGDRPAVNIPANPSGDLPTYDGLNKELFNTGADGKQHFVQRGTGNKLNVPSFDPYEEYQHVNVQVFGNEATPTAPEVASMGGFYRDYATTWDNAEQIMQSYTPEELPVINGLARAFAVSDRYFSSVPTQTNCNRAFAAAGNSLGLSDDGQLEAWVNNRGSGALSLGRPTGKQFNKRTMWNVLSDAGKDSPEDWMIYHSEGTRLENKLGMEGYNYTRDLMEQLQPEEFDHHFDHIDTFYDQAKSGSLPSVCFLEPAWGLQFLGLGPNGNDYHPPTNLGPGETFLKSIYDALTSNQAAWEQTLFIINFDEHGGTYDHVAPPWGAAKPWDSPDTPEPTSFEHGFHFDRFGVRVPLILVSPWVRESVVFRSDTTTPYDHTSVIATILTMLEIPQSEWKLGARVDGAPTFENVLDRSSPRTDVPAIKTNSSWQPTESLDPAPNDIQHRMAATLLSRAARAKGVPDLEILRLVKDLDSSVTVSVLRDRLQASIEGLDSSETARS